MGIDTYTTPPSTTFQAIKHSQAKHSSSVGLQCSRIMGNLVLTKKLNTLISSDLMK